MVTDANYKLKFTIDAFINDQGVPEYQFATTLDRLAGRNLAQWILALYSETEE